MKRLLFSALALAATLTTYAQTPCATTISNTNTTNTYVFTANNLANTPGMSYLWDFGDGTYGSGSPVTHTYSSNGSKFVKLISSAGPPASCTDTSSKWVLVANTPPTPLNCNNLTANFTTSTLHLTAHFYQYSTQVNLPSYATYVWNYGDGTTSSGQNGPHTYAAPGTYTVMLITTWQNSLSTCSDSITKTVTVTAPPPQPNMISGMIMIDTADFDSTMSFKVWLIEHDSANNTLTAVDSTMSTYTAGYSFDYMFNNIPGGRYLTKAHLVNGPSAGIGYIPTYHTSALYWAQANEIFHVGGSSMFNNIIMQKGTITSGPGFVGGNISQGANKGTGAGLGNMLIIIRDNNNNAIRSTFTDGNGNFSVGNLPVGNYSVYPEDLGYATTPASVSITNGKPSVIDINFERSHSNKSIVPVATGISNTTAQQFAVYPNPSKGMIYIQSNMDMNNAAVNVADVTGRTVISTTVQNNKIDMNNLQDGLYYITIETDAAAYTQKVMILH